MADVWTRADGYLKQQNVPIEVVLEVTGRCNLDCCHCYSARNGVEPSLEQLEEIFRQLRGAGCLFLTLTGGEPLAREDFIEVVSRARQRGFDVKIITNGSLMTPEKATALAACAPGEVGVSIHGARAETHDAITRVPGSFRASLAGVDSLKACGVPVHMKCTLMKQNWDERELVRKLAADRGVTCMIDPIVSPKHDGTNDVLGHRLSTERLREVYAEYFDGMDGATEDAEPLFCEAGRTFGAISAEGNVYPCIQLPLKVGNVFDTEFGDIWAASETLEKMRDAEPDDLEECGGCAHASTCYRCPGLAFLEEGNVFGPSPTACFITKARAEFERTRAR